MYPQVREIDPTNFHFQQDDASGHNAVATMQFWQRRHVTSKNDFEWPPRSPDLTIPDFFYWDYLKNKVYAGKLKIIDELKGKIMLPNVMQNAGNIVTFCVSYEGDHLIEVVS